MQKALKLGALLFRRKGFTLDQFSDHWLNVHGPHALKIKLFYQYVQNHRVPEPIPGLEPPCDGMPVVWVKTLADVAALPQDPAYLEGAYVDEPNFMEGRSIGGVMTEQTLVEGSGEFRQDEHPPKALFTFKRRPGMAREAFFDTWQAVSWPWFSEPDGLRRFVRSPMVPEMYATEEPPFDIMEEIWWPDEASYKKAISAPVHSDTLTALCAPGGIKGMRVRERRLRWPH